MFARKYGSDMVNAYRRAATARFGADFFSARNNFGTPLAVSKERGKRMKTMPTFWEFVQFILDTER